MISLLEGVEQGVIKYHNFLYPSTQVKGVSMTILIEISIVLYCNMANSQGHTTGMTRYGGGHTNHFQILLSADFQILKVQWLQSYSYLKIGT